jgi:hypothetical protein
MENKTHWKKLTNPDYLGAYDFQPNEERTVTIKEVKRQTVTGMDGKKEECTVAYFKENYKPMILNATNCKTITKVLKTPYIQDWGNNQVIIVVKQVKAFGEVVDALRIKDQAPNGNQNVTERAKTHIQNSRTLEDLAKVKDYLSTEELRKLYAKKLEELSHV